MFSNRTNACLTNANTLVTNTFQLHDNLHLQYTYLNSLQHHNELRQINAKHKLYTNFVNAVEWYNIV